MDESTANPLSKPLAATPSPSAPKPVVAKPWILPMRGQVLIAVKTEDQIQNEQIEAGVHPGGILVPAMSEMRVDSGRFFGIVLGIGKPPHRFDSGGRLLPERNDWCELEFGDLVEITQHESERLAGEDLFGNQEAREIVQRVISFPLFYFFNNPDPNASLLFSDPEGGCDDIYRVTNSHLLVLCEPLAVLSRLARRDWVFRQEGERPSPHALGDRVLVRNDAAPEKSAGGIILPHWHYQGFRDQPTGEVIACGSDVQDVKPGDWVRMIPTRGARWRDGDVVYTVLAESNLIGRWDSEPSEEEKRAHSAELEPSQVPCQKVVELDPVDYDRLAWEANRPITVSLAGVK